MKLLVILLPRHHFLSNKMAVFGPMMMITLMPFVFLSLLGTAQSFLLPSSSSLPQTTTTTTTATRYYYHANNDNVATTGDGGAAAPRREATMRRRRRTTTTTAAAVGRPSSIRDYYGGGSRRPNLALSARKSTIDSEEDDNDNVYVEVSETADDGKFSFYQRIESVKTAIVGAVSGALLSAPVSALRDLPPTSASNGLASWEFDSDASALQGALFAIVYRYCIREDDDNPMLNMGVVGAFVLVRATSRVSVPGYCTALPLDCGEPLGYLDYELIRQLGLGGAEGIALFGGAAMAMEYAHGKGWISKFPN